MSSNQTYDEVNNLAKSRKKEEENNNNLAEIVSESKPNILPIPLVPVEINFMKGVKFPNVKDKEFCVLGIRVMDKDNNQYGVQFALLPENEKKIRKIFKKLIPINPFQK